MLDIKPFLETSTIHGLSLIASSKSCLRLFWITVVVSGFTGAGVLIYQSFSAWDESPVKTIIETRPITGITYPKVTVCPPKNTFTDLNYDLMMAKNMTMDNGTRNELVNYALELLYDHLYETVMGNFSMLQEKDRYWNWYHGYTNIELRKFSHYYIHRMTYEVTTEANFGTISTPYFGESFDVDKVETDILYRIKIHPPSSIQYNSNITLHFDIEKICMENLASGFDNFYMYHRLYTYSFTDQQYISKNFTPPGGYTSVRLARRVTPQEVRKQKLNLMPGFRLTWHYSGMEVEPEAKYSNQSDTLAFVRDDFNIFTLKQSSVTVSSDICKNISYHHSQVGKCYS